MPFSGELLSLALYFIQQLGVMLGVGAETIILVAYLVLLHTQDSSAKERGFIGSVRSARTVALFFIISSGIVVTIMHAVTSNVEVLLQPAFLFKWALIAVVCVLHLFLRENEREQPVLEGVAGAHWYALFVVHTVAPIISWTNLTILYLGWLVVFAGIWAAFIWAMKRYGAPRQPLLGPQIKIAPDIPPVSTPAPVAVSRPVEKPAVIEKKPEPVVRPVITPVPALLQQHTPAPVLPVVVTPHPVSTPVVVQKSIPPAPLAPAPEAHVTYDSSPDLPAIHVMPKTAADISNRHRPHMMKFT